MAVDFDFITDIILTIDLVNYLVKSKGYELEEQTLIYYLYPLDSGIFSSYETIVFKDGIPMGKFQSVNFSKDYKKLTVSFSGGTSFYYCLNKKVIYINLETHKTKLNK